MELMFLAALVAYALNYIVGRNTLGALVKKWLVLAALHSMRTAVQGGGHVNDAG